MRRCRDVYRTLDNQSQIGERSWNVIYTSFTIFYSLASKQVVNGQACLAQSRLDRLHASRELGLDERAVDVS